MQIHYRLPALLAVAALLGPAHAPAVSLIGDPLPTPTNVEVASFEAAVRKYGGTGLENLYGPGCGSRLRARLISGRKATCVVKYSASLDQPLELPAVLVFQPNHHYWGSQTPESPPRERGSYLYRFSGGVLVPDRLGTYRTSQPEQGRLIVRPSQVVSWSVIVSNDE